MALTVHGIDGIKAQAGADLGHSSWVEIAQPRVDTFADATDDHQWIHVDTERAAAGPFGGTIAHGYLTLSLLIPMWSELLQVEGVSMAVNYGLNKVRFPSPCASVRRSARTAAWCPWRTSRAVSRSSWT